MMIFVAHPDNGRYSDLERAKKITAELQISDMSNCYVCPLQVFEHLRYERIDSSDILDLYGDLMTVCDKVLIVSEIDYSVKEQISLAEYLGMEIEFANQVGWR